jgi:hypothetical protein
MAAKKYVSKIVKFMLSNPADLKRLDALSGISFSKYVKEKLDEDTAGVDPAIVVLQAQVRSLQKEIAELKSHGIPSQILRSKGDSGDGNSSNVNEWFKD